jgi:uncharacterized membrane protein required for colicin V production
MNLNLDSLPFNAFDLALVVILIAGINRGRKQGMSLELMPLLKWLLVLFVCAVSYEPIGSFFSQSTTVFGTLACYLIAYIGAALIIIGIFAAVKHSVGGKLVGSDIFGGAEYYFGMGAGLIRFTCALLVALAILNARYYTPEEVKAEERFQNDVYGSTYFPGLQSLQAAVFERSLTGPWIKDNLSFLLIKPTHPGPQMHQKDATWQ